MEKWRVLATSCCREFSQILSIWISVGSLGRTLTVTSDLLLIQLSTRGVTSEKNSYTHNLGSLVKNSCWRLFLVCDLVWLKNKCMIFIQFHSSLLISSQNCYRSMIIVGFIGFFIGYLLMGPASFLTFLPPKYVY